MMSQGFWRLRSSMLACLLATSIPTTALAQAQGEAPVTQEDGVHLPFDGSAEPGVAYTYGDDAVPVYVAGRSGQAISIIERTVVAVPVSIDPDHHPQLTVAGWIRVSVDADENPYLFSGGGSRLPQLRLEGRRLTARAGYHTRQLDLQVPVDEWVFVAAVWDFAAGTLHLKTSLEDPGVRDAAISAADVNRHSSRRPPGGSDDEDRPYVFIGASHFGNFGYPARGIAIDDVHIIRRALTGEELAALASSTPSPAAPAADSVDSTCDCDGAGVRPQACVGHAECGSGHYCALDQTCHPDRHAPFDLPASDDNRLLPGANQPPAYGSCSVDEDCAGPGDSCLTVSIPAESTEGAMCTRTCTSDDLCGGEGGSSGRCLSISGQPAMCYQRCSTTTDCTGPSTCISVSQPDGLIDRICVPIL